MRGTTISEKIVDVNNVFDSSNEAIEKNGYVLKFDSSSEKKKNNPSSNNLPIVYKRGRILIKKFIVLLLVFIFFFTISVVISYNAVFHLFIH